MKIYDCFTYCGEDELLKIRFETLYKKVNKFVIIEGNRFFNGEKKKKLFNINKFKKYKKKIHYFFLKDFPKHDGNNWNYEFFQRNKISLGLKNINQNDIVLVSDADEIPNLNNKTFMKYDSTIFFQNMYYYKLNVHCYDGLKWKDKWPGTKGCKFKFFETAQKVRELRVKKYPWWRIDRKMSRYIENNGGWHFAYLMSTSEISKKLSRFSNEKKHVLNKKKVNVKKLNGKEIIEKKIKNMHDIYGRKNIKLKTVKIDNTFPSAVYKNIKKYKNFINPIA